MCTYHKITFNSNHTCWCDITSVWLNPCNCNVIMQNLYGKTVGEFNCDG